MHICILPSLCAIATGIGFLKVQPYWQKHEAEVSLLQSYQSAWRQSPSLEQGSWGQMVALSFVRSTAKQFLSHTAVTKISESLLVPVAEVCGYAVQVPSSSKARPAL